jgi:hypothetical protein
MCGDDLADESDVVAIVIFDFVFTIYDLKNIK